MKEEIMLLTTFDLSRMPSEISVGKCGKLGRVEILSEIMEFARSQSSCCIGVEAALEKRARHAQLRFASPEIEPGMGNAIAATL